MPGSDPGWDGYHDPDGPGREWPGHGSHGYRRHRRNGRNRPKLRTRRWFQVMMALVLAFVVWLGWSVGHALTMPGGGTTSERLAEWARDHYLGPLVTLGEWITYKPPKVGGSRRSR